MATLKQRVASILGAAALTSAACSGTVGEVGSVGNGGGGSAGQANAGGSVVGGSAGSGVTGPAGAVPVDPGVLVARRLNHAEYDNTVRDLLGTALKPAKDFPADDLGAEFDTVGSALSLSPGYVLAYETAAYALIDELFAADAVKRARVLSCDVATGGTACARTVIAAFARRAWRRPVQASEVDAMMAPVATAEKLGAKPSEGLRHALAALLMSPYFVFKLELDPQPSSTAVRRLTSHELATRLSYALWSTMPDDALARAADEDKLITDGDIAPQIDRMLADPRADALLDNFAGQWLDFAELDAHEVAPASFPQYKPSLASSMKAEARRFVQEFLRSDLPVSELVNGRFTFVDQALATHYGLPRAAGSTSTALVQVNTTGTPRAGLLGLGAFLMTTSLSSRTSPVKRGQFVFTRLLCGEIPAPPADVPALPENTQGLTGRALAELHRSSPSCQPCHAAMDPIGFGLEKFDALGAYREKQGTAAIDASGKLPSGASFDGASELADALAKDPKFTSCAIEKFSTFALGRLLDQPGDPALMSALAARAPEVGAGKVTLRAIIRTVLLSDAFRLRRPAAIE